MHVVLYNAIEKVTPLGADAAERVLEGLHSNISVSDYHNMSIPAWVIINVHTCS